MCSTASYPSPAIVEKEHWLNVNRRGVVFVPAVAGRDIAGLVARVAEASPTLYDALLELEE